MMIKDLLKNLKKIELPQLIVIFIIMVIPFFRIEFGTFLDIIIIMVMFVTSIVFVAFLMFNYKNRIYEIKYLKTYFAISLISCFISLLAFMFFLLFNFSLIVAWELSVISVTMSRVILNFHKEVYNELDN